MAKKLSRTLRRVFSPFSYRSTFLGQAKAYKTRLPAEPFYPKLLSILRQGYGLSDLFADIMAGITVGLVAMPLAIACAIASGVNPVQGIYTAAIAGVIIGLFGGSNVQISGPTGAFIVIIYGIVYRHGYDGLVITTLLAGIMLCIAGFFRLGTLVKYIPYPVIVGFTAGIGVIIFSSQFGDFLGLSLTNVSPEFFSKWTLYLQNLGNTSYYALALSFSALFLMLLSKKFFPKIPAPVIGILFSTFTVWYFDFPVETIFSRYGELSASLPSFYFPEITMEKIQLLFPDAITIALLAGLESLLTCVVADSMTGDKHYSNIELVAQGMGNLASSVLGGIPATGAIVRTATNISNGAKSPIAAIVHGIVVLGFVLYLSFFIEMIPLACFAAILMLTSYGMLELDAIRSIMRGPRSDVLVMLLTFLLTVLIDLTVAIYAGVLLSSLLFMHKMSLASSICEISYKKEAHKHFDKDEELCASCQAKGEILTKSPEKLPEGVLLLNISGPFFFGMVDRFQHAINSSNANIRVYVLQMRDVLAIDTTGIQSLDLFLKQRALRNYEVVLAEIPPDTRRILRKMGFLKRVGKDNVCYNLECALQRAKALAQS